MMLMKPFKIFYWSSGVATGEDFYVKTVTNNNLLVYYNVCRGNPRYAE